MTPVVGDLIDAGVNLIRSYFPPGMTPEEKADAEAKLLQLKQNSVQMQLNYDQNMEQQRTDRLKADMTSDSWLSKNVRPLVLIYLMAAWTVFAGFSLYNHEVNAAYVDMLKQMLMAAFGFYFVSRGVEKITSIIANKGTQN